MTTQKLGKIILLGGFTIPVVGYGTRWLIQEKIKKSASHIEVLEVVNNHPAIKSRLGENYVIGRVDIGDNKACGQTDNKKWFTLPISGPKARGSLTYWVTITDPANNEFHVSKIEVKVEDKDEAGAKWYLLIRDTEKTVTAEKGT